MTKHILSKHCSGFTIVSNSIIKLLKGQLDALGLYTYLLSLPNEWVFYKSQLSKDCGIGIKKLERLFKILSDHRLIAYRQIRDDRGRFSHFHVDIFDKEHIENNNLHTYPQDTAPEGQNYRTAKTAGRKSAAIKEEIKKEVRKEKKERESAREQKTSLASLPDSFCFDEENKALTNEVAEKVGLSPKQLLDKFIAHAKETAKRSADWQASLKKFLLSERPNVINMYKKNTEVKSNIKFWEPGNPDYDRVNGVSSSASYA